jgi:hypothetical protein
MPYLDSFRRVGTFPSGISQGQLVACAPPTAGNFQVATAGGNVLGVALQDVATAGNGLWKAFGQSYEIQVNANATTPGDVLYNQGSGQVGSNPTAGILPTIGVNLGPIVAASNGGQWIEVLPLY